MVTMIRLLLCFISIISVISGDPTSPKFSVGFLFCHFLLYFEISLIWSVLLPPIVCFPACATPVFREVFCKASFPLRPKCAQCCCLFVSKVTAGSVET